MYHRATPVFASILGFALLPGVVHGEFIEWKYSTFATQSVEVRTDLLPLPNGGNPSGLAHVVLQCIASSRQQTLANNPVRVPLLRNVVFHIDYLGNADWQPATQTIPLYMAITDLASNKTGTLTFLFDAGLMFDGSAGASLSDSPINVNGQSITLGGNQYVVFPDSGGQWTATVQIAPVSANSPEPTGLILGILGVFSVGVVVGVRCLRADTSMMTQGNLQYSANTMAP
jgi:hypothetical protein